MGMATDAGCCASRGCLGEELYARWIAAAWYLSLTFAAVSAPRWPRCIRTFRVRLPQAGWTTSRGRYPVPASRIAATLDAAGTAESPPGLRRYLPQPGSYPLFVSLP